MPRPKTIIVNDLALLRSIYEHTQEVLRLFRRDATKLKKAKAASKSYSAWVDYCDAVHLVKYVKKNGVGYDLEAFAGRPVTPSERIRLQQAIRRLAQQGMLRLGGDRAAQVRVTPRGRDAIQSVSVAAIALTNLSAAQEAQ